MVQESQFIVTIPIVALRLKNYDFLPKLVPKCLEIGAVVHVLRTRTGGRDIVRIEGRLFTLI